MSETNATYSFIDIAAWDGIRQRFLSGKPGAVFDLDMDRLVWANGPAARLFGYGSIAEFENGGLAGMGVVRRQLKAAAGRTPSGEETRTMLRIATGVSSQLLPTTIGRLTGPDGHNYVAIFPEDGTAGDEAQAGARSISGLADEGAGAAVIDGDGGLITANDPFGEIEFPETAIGDMAREVTASEGRVLKRIIETDDGGNLVLAMARLSDDPVRHLVMAIQSPAAEEVEEETAPALAHEDADIGATDFERPADDGPAAEDDVDQVSEEPVTEWGSEPLMAKALVEPEETAVQETEVGAPQIESAEPEFAADLESHTSPIRFVWKTDRDGRFIDISPEFAAAVGPNAADVIGRSFEEVANVFELDPSGEINASLKRRDTWSGKTVLWPVQGLAYRVPVDLAALPSYNRDRDFEGYRGFGIARMGEARPDPEELGLSLVAAKVELAEEPAAIEDDADETPSLIEEEIVEPAAEAEIEPETAPLDDPFEGETPALASISPTPMRREADKVIDLDAKRRGMLVREALSPGEQAAFRRIGETLGWARHTRDDENAGNGTAESDIEAAAVEDGDGYDAAAHDEPQGAEAAPEFGEPEIEDAPVIAEAYEDTPQETEDFDEEEDAPDTYAARLGEESEEEDADLAAEEDEQVEEPESFQQEIAFDREETVAEPAGEAGEEVTPLHAEEEQISDDVASEVEAEDEPVAAAGVTAEFLNGLPLPVLLYREEEALFVNKAFAAEIGYADADRLNEAGGIDALFTGEVANDRVVTLAGPEDEEFQARAHMQTVPWEGRTAVMFSFEMQQAKVEDRDTLDDISSSDAAELRAILDTATDGVVVLSTDGVIRSFNGSASALFGYSREEVEGKSFTMLFAHESQPAAINYVHGLANNGVASVLNEGLEVLGREKNGGFLPLFMTIGRLETSNRLCAVVRDITAWKQTEQALLDAQRSAESASSHKTEFLAKISHEIRTPLNAIIGFSELMAEERFGPIGNERYKSYLADINKSGKYVLDLVNDLLDISKIEAGKQEFDFESVPLNEAVTDAVAMIQPQANRNRIIIRSSLEESLPPIVADARSIKQIVLNLLSNSVRFTHSGGQVIVNSSYNARGEVVLRIKDTGIGMSAKELETALQPFQQVASLGRLRGDGTGLGLPLTKALVEANRAEFAIQSEPGVGTVVEVVFPPSRVLAS